MRTVWMFFAKAAPMVNRQKASDPITYTGVRPIEGRLEMGDSYWRSYSLNCRREGMSALSLTIRGPMP